MLGENVIVVYAIPKIFVTHPIDMQTLLNHVLYLETITFAHLMEGVYASRACKTSIKAGHKLSLPQMEQLIQDGFDKIP
jgi:DNA mismatch repair ATPase MutL